MVWGSSNAKAYKKIHLKTFLNKWVMSTSGLRAYRFGRNKLILKRFCRLRTTNVKKYKSHKIIILIKYD